MNTNNEDQLEIEITDEGLIKISADKISAANHLNAEQFLRNVQELAGGKVTRKHKGAAKGHEHSHGHEHHH